MAEGNTNIESSANNWKESWSVSWKALSQKDVSTTDLADAPGSMDALDNVNDGDEEGRALRWCKGGHRGRYRGAGLVLFGVLGYILVRRRKKA